MRASRSWLATVTSLDDSATSSARPSSSSLSSVAVSLSAGMRSSSVALPLSPSARRVLGAAVDATAGRLDDAHRIPRRLDRIVGGDGDVAGDDDLAVLGRGGDAVVGDGAVAARVAARFAARDALVGCLGYGVVAGVAAAAAGGGASGEGQHGGQKDGGSDQCSPHGAHARHRAQASTTQRSSRFGRQPLTIRTRESLGADWMRTGSLMRTGSRAGRPGIPSKDPHEGERSEQSWDSWTTPRTPPKRPARRSASGWMTPRSVSPTRSTRCKADADVKAAEAHKDAVDAKNEYKEDLRNS